MTSLQFSPNFPGELAGQCFSLKPSDSVIRVGRASICDIVIPVSRQGVSFFSRIQFTLLNSSKIDEETRLLYGATEEWYLIDGGVYTDSLDDSGSYSPSRNGTWIDGAILEPQKPRPLTIGSIVMVAIDSAEILVVADCYPTNSTNEGFDPMWGTRRWASYHARNHGIAPVVGLSRVAPTLVQQIDEAQRIQQNDSPVAFDGSDQRDINSKEEFLYQLIDLFIKAFSDPKRRIGAFFSAAILAGLVFAALSAFAIHKDCKALPPIRASHESIKGLRTK
jgi:FHA domain